jgi:hypothetical protein
MEVGDIFYARRFTHGKRTNHTSRLGEWVDLELIRTFRRREKSPASAGNRTPERPVRSLVNILSTLFWLPVMYRAARNLHSSADVIGMMKAR